MMKKTTFPLLLAALGAMTTAMAAPVALVVPNVKTAPVLDGTLNDPAWKKAKVLELSEKAMPMRPAIPGEKTTLRLLTDGENLFIGVACPFTPECPPKGRTREHDAPVFEDECVEIFLASDGRPNAEDYYHFAVNVRGSATERKTLDPAWNVQWGRAVHLGKDRWTVTLSVPLTVLVGEDATGHYWRINACRDVYDDRGSFVQGATLARPGYYHPSVALLTGPVKAAALLTVVNASLSEMEGPLKPHLTGSIKAQYDKLSNYRKTLSADPKAAIPADKAATILETAFNNAGKLKDMIIWSAMFD